MSKKTSSPTPIDGRAEMLSKQLFLSFGFSSDVNEHIRRNLPNGYELYLSDCVSDLFMIPSAGFFANPECMTDEELEMLMTVYAQMNQCENMGSET